MGYRSGYAGGERRRRPLEITLISRLRTQVFLRRRKPKDHGNVLSMIKDIHSQLRE